MYIRTNKTHLRNLIKLLNSLSELDSLIFWGTIFHIFGPKCRTD